MAKELTEHFAVIEDLHTATKTVAVEKKIEINELVKEVLLRDKSIAQAYKRIGGE
jgi:hypothetical protein